MSQLTLKTKELTLWVLLIVVVTGLFLLESQVMVVYTWFVELMVAEFIVKTVIIIT